MKTSRKITLITFVITVMVLINFPRQTVRADAAPPGPPPGEGVQPDVETTMVQMVAEQVLIDVSDRIKTIEADQEYEDWDNTINGYEVSFQATFWMKNQGDESESMAVRFPLNADSGWGTTFTVSDFSVHVDGNRVKWRQGTHPESWEQFIWAYFDVTFPPGEEVVIRVNYSTITFSDPQIAEEGIEYILQTGAGWYGPIEYGEIILSLPYDAIPITIENKFSKTPSETVYFDGKAHWYFNQLEPEDKDNIRLEIMSPKVWQDINQMRGILENDSENLSALKTLGDACIAASINTKAYGVQNHPDLFLEGLSAYEKAASLGYQNLEFHINYAKALTAYYEFPDERYADQLAEQIEIIKQLDSDNPELSWLQRRLADYREYLIPTSTPTATMKPTLTQTLSPTHTLHPPTATATAIPNPTATITPTPTLEQVCVEQSDVIGWGVIIGVFLVAGGVFFGKRWKRNKSSLQ